MFHSLISQKREAFRTKIRNQELHRKFQNNRAVTLFPNQVDNIIDKFRHLDDDHDFPERIAQLASYFDQESAISLEWIQVLLTFYKNHIQHRQAVLELLCRGSVHRNMTSVLIDLEIRTIICDEISLNHCVLEWLTLLNNIMVDSMSFCLQFTLQQFYSLAANNLDEQIQEQILNSILIYCQYFYESFSQMQVLTINNGFQQKDIISNITSFKNTCCEPYYKILSLLTENIETLDYKDEYFMFLLDSNIIERAIYCLKDGLEYFSSIINFLINLAYLDQEKIEILCKKRLVFAIINNLNQSEKLQKDIYFLLYLILTTGPFFVELFISFGITNYLKEGLGYQLLEKNQEVINEILHCFQQCLDFLDEQTKYQLLKSLLQIVQTIELTQIDIPMIFQLIAILLSLQENRQEFVNSQLINKVDFLAIQNPFILQIDQVASLLS